MFDFRMYEIFGEEDKVFYILTIFLKETSEYEQAKFTIFVQTKEQRKKNCINMLGQWHIDKNNILKNYSLESLKRYVITFLTFLFAKNKHDLFRHWDVFTRSVVFAVCVVKILSLTWHILEQKLFSFYRP